MSFDAIREKKNLAKVSGFTIYTAFSSCVRINVLNSEWFDVTSGQGQCCSLSRVLFNVFIYDLAIKIKACGKGVKIDDDTVGILLYADDIVLLVDNEKELQDMLDILNNWCVSNNMSVLMPQGAMLCTLDLI